MNKTSELLSPRAAPSAAQVEIRPPQQLMKPNEPSVCWGLRAGSLCLPGKKAHTKLDKLVPVREEEEGEEQEEGWVVIRQQVPLQQLLSVAGTAEVQITETHFSSCFLLADT